MTIEEKIKLKEIGIRSINYEYRRVKEIKQDKNILNESIEVYQAIAVAKINLLLELKLISSDESLILINMVASW